MGANARKLPSCSESPETNLTIFDAPNVCRDMMAKCQVLIKHADPEVSKLAAEIHDGAKGMLDAIVASVDQILALET